MLLWQSTLPLRSTRSYAFLLSFCYEASHGRQNSRRCQAERAETRGAYMTDKIGFIGVGTMGEPMCRNLARKSGATVLAADRNPEPLTRLAADGVKAASLDEIVENCRTIFLSLPGGKEVEQVCLGDGGILSRIRMGWTIVDTSTAPVSLARRLYAEFEGKASAFADAPIARTRQAAIDGTLSIMVGGTEETFKRIEPLLR